MPFEPLSFLDNPFDSSIVAISIPLFMAFLTWRLLDWPSFVSLFPTASSKSGPFSLQNAYRSYLQYTSMSMHELGLMENAYARPGLTRSERRISLQVGYPEKLRRLRETISVNARVTESIARLARSQFPETSLVEDSAWTWSLYSSFDWGDLNKTRESLKHFVRDWSEEGAPERNVIFEPILQTLRREVTQRRSGAVNPTVLVPGCGLGRLAWEISELGYNVTALEISFFQTLALRFLLSPESTSRRNQHVLHPYSSWFSHQRNNDNLFRKVSFPDVLPRLDPGKLQLAEEDFLKHHPKLPELGDATRPAVNFWSNSVPVLNEGHYDYIVTLFFIDTSLNIIATITKIHELLKPGGIWINLGPLLWLGGARARLELSLDEVIKVSEEVGFEFAHVGADPSDKTMTVKCEYTSDAAAMMQWTYHAQFWVAKKA